MEQGLAEHSETFRYEYAALDISAKAFRRCCHEAFDAFWGDRLSQISIFFAECADDGVGQTSIDAVSRELAWIYLCERTSMLDADIGEYRHVIRL